MKYKIRLDRPEKIYFTSDWHLFHNNILRYDTRPFKNVYDMNETIISNHEKLDKDAHLFILGDLTFKLCNELHDLLDRVKCNKYFVVGNHDRDIWNKEFLRRHFDEWYSGYCELTVGKQLIVMGHYPMVEWNRGHHGSWMLFGHTHGNDNRNPFIKDYKTKNVGCMLNNYLPFSYYDIEKNFRNRKNIFHH